MIDVDDWAEIRRLHRAEGMGIRAIARRLGLARNTVRVALRAEGPPRYVRAAKGSVVDAVEPAVVELLREFPAMPATVIAERIGWTRSIRVLRDRVAELRPLFVPPDPCQRTCYFPGESPRAEHLARHQSARRRHRTQAASALAVPVSRRDGPVQR